jgi:hypothetical protein
VVLADAVCGKAKSTEACEDSLSETSISSDSPNFRFLACRHARRICREEEFECCLSGFMSVQRLEQIVL